MSIQRYLQWLPLKPGADVVSLGEGDTPLVASRAIGPGAGLSGLHFKCEQANPSGSYKDRFAALQVSLFNTQGFGSFIATSSGNTGAALAAYAARAGIRCRLFVNEHTPDGKLLQMMAYGAELFRVNGFGVTEAVTADIFARLVARGARSGEPLAVSAYRYSPEGMEGVKTIAYEIAERFPEGLDDVFLPVGGGGLLTAVARGFADVHHAGHLKERPRIHAVQPTKNDTIVTPLRQGGFAARRVPTVTEISGLAVPTDIDGTRALMAVRESGGMGFTVEDEEVWQVQKEMLRSEGLFVEPAAVVSVAGALKARAAGAIRPDARVVCVLTGHGFKDMHAVGRSLDGAAPKVIDPEAIDRL